MKLKKCMAIAVIMAITMGTFAGCGEKEVVPGSDNLTAGSQQKPSDGNDADLYVNEDWEYGQVSFGGGGFVTGVFSSASKNLYYARTDVGGAYRYDAAKGRWESISTSVTQDDRGYLGVAGMAIDKNNSSHIILLCGTSYFSDGKTAVMISNDGGTTYDTVDVTELIKVDGNGMGRQNGERIAFDPENPLVVYAGGYSGGLIKSTDGGYTWTKLDGFPVESTDNGTGVNGIVVVPAAETGDDKARIYVSVSRSGDTNIYVSENEGESWDAVVALPMEYMPQRIKSDNNGNLLITYGGSEGPWNGSGGAIYRYSIADDRATDISVGNLNMGDIVFDPSNTDRMVACTENVWSLQPNGSYGDEFYVTEDGGVSWRKLNDVMKMDETRAEWVADYAIHWCGSMMLDPFNTDMLMVVSGNGIFRCDNIWDEEPEFYFFSEGIEETVPLDAVSLKDGTLAVVIGDYDGFVTNDVTKPATYQESIGGTTSGIAICASDTDFRIKVGNNDKKQMLMYTYDGGETWTKITNKPVSKLLRGGSVAISADGSRIFWSPDNEFNSYYSDDLGETWNEIQGLTAGYYIFADPMNKNYVYACANETFYVSSDGGETFTISGLNYNAYDRFAVEPDGEGKIYVACGLRGVQVSADHGTSFTQLNVSYAESVGLGAGKTESDPYAIYIYGRPVAGDNLGIYMSSDGGESWVRVNDDLHNYGGTGNAGMIIGDYGVYGRCYMSTVGMGLAYFDLKEK